MEILGVEFESWNVVLLRLNWFAIIIFLAVAFLCAQIYRIVNQHINRKSIIIDEFNLGIGNSNVKFKYDRKDQEIAYKLWVELSTRKIGIMFDQEHDVIAEVYNSWYEFFKIARELLKNIPASRLPYSHDLIELTEKVLNKDDDGTILPRKEWGYCVNAVINGYRISSPDDSWYLAWQGMNACVKWAISQPHFNDGPGKIIEQINQELQEE